MKLQEAENTVVPVLKNQLAELAVPITNFELKAGSVFKFSLQYNNYIPADKASIASGYQKTDGSVDLTLSAEKAVAVSTALAASGAAFVSIKKRRSEVLYQW